MKNTFKIAKCGECPFYHEDDRNVRNSYCRYGNGWGWGLMPTEDCHFNQTLSRLRTLFATTKITW